MSKAQKQFLAQFKVDMEKCGTRIMPQNTDGFDELFRELQVFDQQVRLNPDEFYTAKLGSNIAKNRFPNVLPNEGTRAVLEPVTSAGDGDYINANYVEGEKLFGIPFTYVATQAPMKSTVNDFWRLVYEHNIHLLVMLTDLVENNQVRCEQYWPAAVGQSARYGSITIKLESYNAYPDSTFQTMTLKHDSSDVTRTIQHYRYRTWPDGSVPSDAGGLTEIIYTIGQQDLAAETPILVHCGAGVGRTGVFIVLHVGLSLFQMEIPFQVTEVIRKLRMCRSGMVQRKDQFVFCYYALYREMKRMVWGHLKPSERGSKKLPTDDPQSALTTFSVDSTFLPSETMLAVDAKKSEDDGKKGLADPRKSQYKPMFPGLLRQKDPSEKRDQSLDSAASTFVMDIPDVNDSMMSSITAHSQQGSIMPPASLLEEENHFKKNVENVRNGQSTNQAHVSAGSINDIVMGGGMPVIRKPQALVSQPLTAGHMSLTQYSESTAGKLPTAYRSNLGATSSLAAGGLSSLGGGCRKEQQSSHVPRSEPYATSSPNAKLVKEIDTILNAGTQYRGPPSTSTISQILGGNTLLPASLPYNDLVGTVAKVDAPWSRPVTSSVADYSRLPTSLPTTFHQGNLDMESSGFHAAKDTSLPIPDFSARKLPIGGVSAASLSAKLGVRSFSDRPFSSATSLLPPNNISFNSTYLNSTATPAVAFRSSENNKTSDLSGTHGLNLQLPSAPTPCMPEARSPFRNEIQANDHRDQRLFQSSPMSVDRSSVRTVGMIDYSRSLEQALFGSLSKTSQ